jgi:uncharacterized protein
MNEEASEFAAFPNNMGFLLVCVNHTHESVGLYNATRYSWKIRPAKARGRYVVAVSKGVILGVFEASKWLPAEKRNFPDIPDEHGNWKKQEGRFGFIGRPASEKVKQLYLGKRIPPTFRFLGNPIRYIN